MINPEDTGLLLFDVDGTISVTTKPIYEAVKRAFAGIGLQLEMSPTEMESWFGAPSADFYAALNPPHSPVTWQDMRARIHQEQIVTYKELGQTYPEVKPTLVTLRERGYKLALFSNSTPGYFYNVIEALGLADLFDYTECVGENDLTKTQLAAKIIRHFNGIPTAIVGDRSHDIQAARDNQALAIGAGYGYGNDEPQQADIVITEFKQLLDIFDRRIPVFCHIMNGILEKKQPGRPVITGISGIDASGKTRFTLGFERFLTGQGYKVQIIHLDDFLNPRSIRYAGEDEVDNYLNRSFNFQLLLNELLRPARDTGSFDNVLTLVDHESDTYSRKKTYTVNQDTIILLEGVFLFRPDIYPLLDYSVFLDIGFDECLERARIRDNAEVFKRYETKYIPGQKQYLADTLPKQKADLIIDNSNWDNPVLIS